MPVITPYLINPTKTSSVTQPFTAGTVTITVNFPTPMKDTNYIPTFSLGAGVALPAISFPTKTVNGYTATFVAVTSGTIVANVIYL